MGKKSSQRYVTTNELPQTALDKPDTDYGWEPERRNGREARAEADTHVSPTSPCNARPAAGLYNAQHHYELQSIIPTLCPRGDSSSSSLTSQPCRPASALTTAKTWTERSTESTRVSCLSLPPPPLRGRERIQLDVADL